MTSESRLRFDLKRRRLDPDAVCTQYGKALRERQHKQLIKQAAHRALELIREHFGPLWMEAASAWSLRSHGPKSVFAEAFAAVDTHHNPNGAGAQMRAFFRKVRALCEDDPTFMTLMDQIGWKV